MKKETENGFSRRKFLKSSVGAAVMIGCFTKAELREALAQAKLAGKPLLGEASINAHIAFSATAPQKSRNITAFSRQVAEFKLNPKTYLTRYFHVTPGQLAEIEGSLDSNTMRKLSAFLDQAVRERKPIRVVVTHGAAQNTPQRGSASTSPLQSRVRYASLALEKMDLDLKFGIFEIHWHKDDDKKEDNKKA